MENYFGEDNGWHMGPFPLPIPLLLEDEGMQQMYPFDSRYNLDEALAEYTTAPVNKSNTPVNSTHHQNSAKTEQEARQESPSETGRSGRRTMVLEPKPTQRRKPRAFSPDAVERRRRQNRASQIAFRERSRKKMEYLHQELSLSAKYNQQIYQTMRGLLEQTQALKAAIEHALASFPLSNPEYLSQNSSEYYGRTPSDSDGPAPILGMAGLE